MENDILTTSGLSVPVVFVKSARARRLVVSIKPFKPIRVSFPARVSQKKAQEFLQSNMEWVKKAIAKIKEIESQRANQTVLPAINKNDAKAVLTARLKSLAAEYGFSYNRVFIRNQKTRWGSCSGSNNISLNVNLVRLPAELQDYVILHELVHTKIKNHSRRFWSELDKYVADSKKTAKRLRKHGLSLFQCAA